MSLLDKMRRAREQRVDVGGFTFIVRRPTFAQVLAFNGADLQSQLVQLVVGWERVRELDLIAGGSPEPAPFDAAVCAEWLADRPDLAGPLAQAAATAFRDHRDRLEAAAGN